MEGLGRCRLPSQRMTPPASIPGDLGQHPPSQTSLFLPLRCELVIGTEAIVRNLGLCPFECSSKGPRTQ